MTESSTPSGAEQLRIIKALLQSNADYRYLVSTSWIIKWMEHVERFDKAVNPGKLTMLHDCHCFDQFDDLDSMCTKSWFTNMWVHEPIWCKWVQWYGVDDCHELDRCTSWSYDRENIRLALKSHLSTRLEIISKELYLDEKCSYIELQLRRIFGVTHDTATQLRLKKQGVMRTSSMMGSTLLMDCIKNMVRYDIDF